MEKIDDILVFHGGGGVRVNSGDGGGMNLGQDRVIFSWCGNDEVDGLLFNIQAQADLAWDSDSDGSGGFNYIDKYL